MRDDDLETGQCAAYFRDAQRSTMHLVSHAAQPHTVVTCEQRTDEWFAARAGRVTSSKAHLLFQEGRKKGEPSKQRLDYLMQLACEQTSGVSLEDPDEYRGKWVERGKLLEGEARAGYEARFGVIVQTVGFLAHNTMAVGSSIDGFVGSTKNVVCEFKVPKPTTHWNYINRNVLPLDYQYQVMTHLWMTDCARVDFVSYCPQMAKALRFYVKPIVHGDFSQEVWREFEDGIHNFLAQLRSLQHEMVARIERIEATALKIAVGGV